MSSLQLMANTSTMATVTVEEDWQVITPVPGGMVLEDQQTEWLGQGYELDEELALGWADPKNLMTPWAATSEMLPNEELEAVVSHLPSSVEESWLDVGCFFDGPDSSITNHDKAGVPEILDCESTDIWVEELEEFGCDTKKTSYDDMSQIMDLLIGSDSTYTANDIFSDQAITVDCSQLELLLTESIEITHALRGSRNDVSDTAAETLDDSHCESSDDECDSDWSYTGIKRRRSSGPIRRARSKPYSRPNKKSKFDRKKEQNKSAATRYRERKRAEEQDNENECVELERKNHELRSRVAAMSHEVDVMRKLVIDIYRKD